MAEYKQLEFSFMKKEKSLSSKIIDFGRLTSAGLIMSAFLLPIGIMSSQTIKDYRLKKKDPIAYEKQRLEKGIALLESRYNKLSKEDSALERGLLDLSGFSIRAFTLPFITLTNSVEYLLTGQIKGHLERAIEDMQRLKQLKEDYSKIEELERKYKNQKTNFNTKTKI